MTIVFRRFPSDAEAHANLARALSPRVTTAPCVVLGSARHAELPGGVRPLALIAARSGRVICDVASRRVAVDDDAFLVLNAGSHGAASIHAADAVECTQIYFPAAMIADVEYASDRSPTKLLDDPLATQVPNVDFREHLTRHERSVSPVLRYVQHCIRSGQASPEWLDEQLSCLLHRVFILKRRTRERVERLNCVRSATRLELYRRVAQAADYIDSNFERAFGLQELASVACLSRFHLLRLFRQIYGVTPHSYKEQKRVLVARRLLAAGRLSRAEVATQVGYATRAGLSAQLQRWDSVVGEASSTAQLLPSSYKSSQVPARQLATS
jgi:AraC family transcriptional regulator